MTRGRSRLPASRSALDAGELDRLAWVAAQSITCYGVCLRLRATEPWALRAMLERLPVQWAPSRSTRVSKTYSLIVVPDSGAARNDHVLYRDQTELFRGLDLETVLERFEAAARFHLAEMSPQRTFVHAGVVGWAGRAILLPGYGGAGKTTLTAALVSAGASYLSDEYALIDDSGRAHPFPKPLSIAQGRGVRSILQPVEALGGVQETRPLPAGLVVITSHDDVREHREWRPRRLTPGKGVLELLKHTVSAQRRPENAVRRLQRVVTQAAVLKGARGDAGATAELILERLETDSRRAMKD